MFDTKLIISIFSVFSSGSVGPFYLVSFEYPKWIGSANCDVPHGIDSGCCDSNSAGYSFDIKLDSISQDRTEHHAARHDSCVVLGSVFFQSDFKTNVFRLQ
jgi:hypothetical protein